MNALLNYGTDSESDDDDTISHTHSASIQAQNKQDKDKDKEEEQDEDDSIMAALQDLQDFAASVNENQDENVTQKSSTRDASSSGSGEPMVQDDDELKFLSFLQEIDAIPNPDESQQQPPPPPPPPPAEFPLIIDNIPPPPPPPPSSAPTTIPPGFSSASSSTSQALSGTGATTESIQQSVQMIYNRLYYISLLPSASAAFQDLERRLLEFAIRIVDWKKGGMEEAYFLGQELVDALNKKAATSNATMDDHEAIGREEEKGELGLPQFGGIVGSMIQYMFRLEQMATPNGWMAVWDTEDEAYGFQHVRTGLYSPVYPSPDLITTLDPPAPHSRISPTTYKSNSWTYYSSATLSSSPSTPTTPTSATVTMTAPALNPWAAPTTTPPATSSPQSVGSDSLAQSPSQPNNSTTKPAPSEPTFGAAKKKKRKLEDSSSASGAGGEDGSLFDQSIHPSRRAALVKTGGGSPGGGSGGKASSSSSTKVMPKKLASLLQ
ncbi:hypothetical protein BGW39_004380, partial [Mortierella sp. 14UC]